MRKYSFLALLLLAFGLSAVAQHTDTLQQAVHLTDSLRQEKNWEVRTPLTEEEIQRREDNRARVERMKERYRAFHDTENQQREQTEQNARESDFLWSDAEKGGGGAPASSTTTTPKGETTSREEEEALRLEISRNLQYGKSSNTSPPAPVKPTLPDENLAVPEAYEQPHTTSRIPNQTTDLKQDIQAAFQTDNTTTETDPTNDQWLTKTGSAATGSATTPQSYQQLRASQTYRLAVSFPDQQFQLDPTQLTDLNTWALWLQAHTDMKVEVRAYTHHKMDQLDAINLSIQRAKIITEYWQQQGVATQQISYRGYGSLSPLIPINHPDAQQKNERIEVIILELPAR